jgi:hypothetical protein
MAVTLYASGICDSDAILTSAGSKANGSFGVKPAGAIVHACPLLITLKTAQLPTLCPAIERLQKYRIKPSKHIVISQESGEKNLDRMSSRE